MKKLFMIFVCSLLLFPLFTFADEGEGEMERDGSLSSFAEEGKRPRPMLFQQVKNEMKEIKFNFRHDENQRKQSSSHIKQLEQQLKQIRDQIKQLKEKAEEIKGKIAEGETSGKADWKMNDDDRFEDDEMMERDMEENEEGNKRRSSMMQNIKRRLKQGEDTEMKETGEMMREGKEIKRKPRQTIQQRIKRKREERNEKRKREMRMDANIFSPDQEKVRVQASKAQSKLSRFRDFFFRR